MSSRTLKSSVAASIVASIIIVASLVFVYQSPDLSWSSAIRDHDGDGVPDKSDPSPFNAQIRGIGDGSINLTIHNNASYRIQLSVRAFSYDLIENLSYGGLFADPGSDVSLTLNPTWWIGQDSTNVYVESTGFRDPWTYGGNSWYDDIVVSNGHSYELSVVFPNDFSVIIY